ncbi:imidazole glycerol phosphate synthase subunit HisH [Candidatus Kaiserbacteria bacterium CG10_big_fil_rev_8_21_14_0_10_59_10]|uniref:Imidazole glycerol phosphate synthase subunit HisH n=1 Tax=Candidatus Kaiserbacteria bacterium CG10_big_fil_rev_8_21_14_0_10_59_10 TaxID=1974612 RepID=A0A2H0U7Q7_9BACT|nr:MAG: imidazole glycerol phosphate synthase subunit HisH [Candidatus Kaiserbacteria bacterium CG10_big_fil_rev_8_21_14_0_10_59_10]
MIAIVDYGMGNVGSVRNALRFLGAEGIVTAHGADFEKASHIILPGVGAFPDGMRRLKSCPGFSDMEREVLVRGKPFLGICLGMQFLATYGEEAGGAPGLGWIEGRVERLRVDEDAYRLPHIGWNEVAPIESSILFKSVPSRHFYFVHSYVLRPNDPNIVVGTCAYGETFPVAVEKGNIFGTQFHPEKSQKGGLAVLKNFISYA